MRTVLMTGLLVATAGLAQAQVQFVEFARTNVAAAANPTSAWYIGRNVSTVAWDGTNAYIAGQSFDTSGVGIAKFTPQTTSTSGLFQLSGRFGALPNAGTRGYQDLTLRADGRLAAAFDNGSNNPSAYTQFNSGTGALINSSLIGTRANGVHYDPVDGRLTGIALGSGRVHKINDDGTTYNDGVKDWNTAAGPTIFPNPLSTTGFRDMTMDPQGNLIWRAQNGILRAARKADGTGYDAPTLVRNNLVDNINGQNIEYMSVPTISDFLLYTNRLGTAAGQSFTNVIRGITVGGVDVPLSFTFLPGLGAAPTGTGYYDFSYHAPTQTLAVSDFSNNTVYFFNVIPTPGALAAVGLAGLVAARRRRA